MNRDISSEQPVRRRLALVIAGAAILAILLPVLALTVAGGLGGSIESVIR